MAGPDGIQLRISVVITNHNYGRFVTEAIDSVFAQTVDPFEVIVVDDGSTDDSLETLGTYGPKIRIVAQSQMGFCSALQAGVEASSGDIVHLLDADDTLEPNALREIGLVFASNPDVVQVSVGRTTMNAAGVSRPSRPIRFSRGSVSSLLQSYGRYLCATTSGLSYRREVLVGMFPLAGAVDTADTYTTIGAAFAGRVEAIEKPLYRYRIHGKNMQVGQADIAFLINQREAASRCIELRAGTAPARDNELIALHSARGDSLGIRARVVALLSTAVEISRIEGLSVTGLLQLISRSVMLVYPSQGPNMIRLGPGLWLKSMLRIGRDGGSDD